MKVPIISMGAVTHLGLGPDILCNYNLNKPHQRPKSRSNNSSEDINIDAYTIGSVDEFLSYERREIRFLTKGTKYLLAAVDSAKENCSDFDFGKINPDDLGIVVGSNYGGLDTIANFDWTIVTEGPEAVSVMAIPNTLTNAPAVQMAIKLQAKAFNSTIATGRTCALDAIGYACKFINSGRARYVYASAMEEMSPHLINAMQSIEANRGSPVSEAAGTLLLGHSDLVQAESYIIGWRNTCSTDSSLSDCMTDVINQVLNDAGLTMSDVAFVIGSINSSRDEAIIDGLAATAKNMRENIKFVSVSGYLGNTYGVSGILNVIVATFALKKWKIPGSAIPHGINISEKINISSEVVTFEKGVVLAVEADHSGICSAILISR